jgi:hypothetical protein
MDLDVGTKEVSLVVVSSNGVLESEQVVGMVTWSVLSRDIVGESEHKGSDVVLGDVQVGGIGSLLGGRL